MERLSILFLEKELINLDDLIKEKEDFINEEILKLERKKVSLKVIKEQREVLVSDIEKLKKKGCNE